MSAIRSVPLALLVSLATLVGVAACGDDEPAGTTPKCDADASDCFTAVDGGLTQDAAQQEAAAPDADPQEAAAQDDASQD